MKVILMKGNSLKAVEEENDFVTQRHEEDGLVHIFKDVSLGMKYTEKYFGKKYESILSQNDQMLNCC